MNKTASRGIVIFTVLSILLGILNISTFAKPDSENTSEIMNGATQANWNVNYLGQVGGHIVDVAIREDYAYVGVGPRLVVMDISDPSQPTVIGESQPFPSYSWGVAVSGDFAYVADMYAGLRIIDISVPTDPVEVGSYEILERTRDVAVVGGYAYVADANGGLRVVDISDPSNPFEVGFNDALGYANAVVIKGNYAYVAAWEEGLRILDISNPTDPVEVGFYLAPDVVYHVAISGDYAFVTAGFAGLRVINISNPASPIEVSFYDPYDYPTPSKVPNMARDVTVSGSYTYIADSNGGLRVVNISDPIHPIEVGYYDTTGTGLGVAVMADYAYVAALSFMVVVDISDPTNPLGVGQFGTPGGCYGMAVFGDLAYIVGNDGLWIVNIADPHNPFTVGNLDVPGILVNVAISESYAYVVGDISMWVVDISNPANPIAVGAYDLPEVEFDRALGVAVSGRYAYIAHEFAGLRVVDVSNPSNPIEVGFYDTLGGAQSVAIEGHYAYVAFTNAGLRVLDVSDPTDPVEVGVTEPSVYASGVAISGHYAYVVNSYTGLRIIDIADPTHPFEISYYDTPNFAEDLFVSGGYVYIAEREDIDPWDPTPDLRVIDVSDPAHPLEVGYYDTAYWSTGVVAVKGYVYVATEATGLYVLRHDIIDNGFRPNPNGYKFRNWGKDLSTLVDFTPNDMRQMFGDEAVCIDPGCNWISPTALLWNLQVIQQLLNGRCTGMNSTSLRFFTDADQQSAIQPLAATTYELEKLNARRNISYFQALGYTPALACARHLATQVPPSQVATQIHEALSSDSEDPLLLTFFKDPTAGHAVVPYAMRAVDVDTWLINVYDPNYPGETYPHMIVDGDHWAYNMAAPDQVPDIWEGGSDVSGTSFYVLTVSAYQPLQIDLCPWCGYVCEDSIVLQETYFDGSGHLLISDASENHLGFVGDEYVEGIPDAFGSGVPGWSGTSIEPIYYTPTNNTYTILIDGQTITETEHVSVMQFGPEYGSGIKNMSLEPSTTGTLVISPTGYELNFSPSNPNHVDLLQLLSIRGTNYHFFVQGFAVGSGQKVTMSAMVDQLILDNSENQDSGYSLIIIRYTEQGLHIFRHMEIEIDSQDSHFLNFADWDGSGALYLDIDRGSNGSIDDQLSLENEYSPIFIPMIMR